MPAFNLSTVTLAKLRKRFPTTIILMRLVQLLEVWELQLAYMSLPLSLVALMTFSNHENVEMNFFIMNMGTESVTRPHFLYSEPLTAAGSTLGQKYLSFVELSLK